MTTTLLTPVSNGKARPVGASLWRRQLLPLGEINYEGRKIKFDRDYLASLVKAFAAKAIDAVPFQFADVDNKHTNRPEDRRGTVKALELTPDGLDVLIEAGPAAAKILQEYPDLGVSASIKEGYERSDGRFFPAAIKHVLATLDPRIPGMRQWEAVEASNPAGGLWELCTDLSAEDGDVINLTSYDYAAPDVPAAPERPAETAPVITSPTPPTAATEPSGAAQEPSEGDTSMPRTKEQEDRLTRLLDLPEDQFTALLAAKPGPEPEGDGDDGETEMTDAELQALIDGIPDDPSEVAEPELVEAGAQLSYEDRASIDLANAQLAEQSIELASMRAERDLAKFEKERDQFTRLGIGRYLVDLARPLLEGSGRTVELSNGSTADAGSIVRKLLTEFGKTTSQLGLGVELGNAEGADDPQAAEELRAQERAQVKASIRASQGR